MPNRAAPPLPASVPVPTPAGAANAAPTISDLALHLGVHKSTVSRAMDPARRHLISADVLRRVEAAAKRIGYRPNHAAAALSTGRTKTIGVLLPDITNPVFPPILRGIEDALDADGYFALLANTDSARHAGAAQAAVERMRAQRVDGLLIATAVRDDAWLAGLANSGARIVLVNRTDGRGALPAVVSDDAIGMRLAVDHLVGLGHTRLLHLSGPQSMSTGFARRVGFELALQAHALAPAALAECSAYSVAAGHAALAALLATAKRRGRRQPGFSAIVAANDLIAIGALQALRERGLAVPADVSVVGHNDMPLLDQLSPALTTVRIQHHAMGFQAARLLLQAIAGAPAASETTLVLRPSLVVRASTAPPG